MANNKPAPDDLTELENSRELIHQLQIKQEALQAANEELAATEEELRVQNEELNTSRAELERIWARYKSLFEMAPDAYIVTDPEGAIQEANQAAARLFNRQAANLKAFPFTALLPATEKDNYLRFLTALSSGGTSQPKWELEMINRQTGPPFWVSITSAAAYDDSGNISSLLWLIGDITERKQAEEQLKDLNEALEKRVEERTMELAHRNLQLRHLTADLTLAEQRERQRLAMLLHDNLQQMLVAAKFRIARLERNSAIRETAAEISDLISDCIEISRSLTAELSPAVLYTGGLLSGMQWLAKWMGDKHGLTVKLSSREPFERAPEDIEILLFQSVRELLFNVVKHAATKQACVDVAQADGCIQVKVSDDGAGFDREALQSKGNSEGMGLFSIRERLEYLGGRMEIESAPGQGSRFTLITPLPMDSEQSSRISSNAQSGWQTAVGARPKADKGHASKRIRVVLVDDHMVVRQGLASLLGAEADIEMVGEASDGESAVNLVREIRPDVVLMDISMPGMDGIQATKIIHQEMPDVQVVGVSMFQEGQQATAICDAGAVGYVTKSAPSNEVLALIRACAGKRSK
jgi:PAS domain S-box-containing protein